MTRALMLGTACCALVVVGTALGQVREARSGAPAVATSPGSGNRTVLTSPAAESSAVLSSPAPGKPTKEQGQLPIHSPLGEPPRMEAQFRRVAPPAGANTDIETSRAAFSRIKLTLNKSMTMRLDYPFSDVLVGSSDIAEVVPISDRMLYLLGKRTGTTNVSVFDANKKMIGLLDVEVGVDIDALQGDIAGGTGSRAVRARSQGGGIVLSGVAPDAVTVDRAFNIAKATYPD